MAAKKPATNDIVVALQSFIGRIDGVDRPIGEGDTLRVSDPAVRKWPSMFAPHRVTHEARVEQATAVPGEKR